MSPEPRPPLSTYEDIAGMIDHSLLWPELTEDEVIEGCELARRYGVAGVTVRPCDVDTAVRILGVGSAVRVGTVAGFPHGSSTTAVKLYEARDALRRGAREIDVVVGISRLLSRQFQHVQVELLQMGEACHQQGAILKVILENAYLTDELKIVGCRIAGRAGADFVKTSTGFASSGYTLADLKLMRAHAPAEVGIKAEGGVHTLEAVKEVYEAGSTRVGVSATAAILDAWKAELAARVQPGAQA